MNYDQYLIELLELLEIKKEDLVSSLEKSDQALSENWFNGTSKPNKNSRKKISKILFYKKSIIHSDFIKMCSENNNLEVVSNYMSRLYDFCFMMTENHKLEELIIKQKIEMSELNKIISTHSSVG